MKKFCILLICMLLVLLSACGLQDVPTDDKSDSSNSDFEVSAKQVDSVMENISAATDGIAEKLQSFGLTEDEARTGREVLLSCGVESIDICEPTDSTATVDGLIAFRGEIDKDRTFWFTIENREIFYVSLNGVDLYDSEKGGYLVSIEDVHIPVSDVPTKTYIALQRLTEAALEPYFKNSKWFDAWGIGRADENYMVQCEVYASNDFKVSDWVLAKVWYTEQEDSSFVVVGVQIDGVQYEVIG